LSNLLSWLATYVGSITLGMAVLLVILLGAIAWLATRMRRLERHYRTLTAGTAGGTLEAVLEEHVGQVRDAVGRVQMLDAAVRQMERDNCGHVQHLGIMRFNPFRETGGDQSFVLALADGRGNGAVISTLHSRDVTRVYAKPLAAWESAYPLTDEEQAVIRKARGDAQV
jgi:HAMP domain-containing protein